MKKLKSVDAQPLPELPERVTVKQLAIEMASRHSDGSVDAGLQMQRRIYRAISDGQLTVIYVVGQINIPRAAALQMLSGEPSPWRG